MIPALMEETLVLLKPDCLEGRKCGEVLKRFEEAGFDVFGVKMMRLSDEILREHYAHLADKPFSLRFRDWRSLNPWWHSPCAARTPSPACATWSARPTPPSPRKAPSVVTFGQDKMRNLVHASDSVENGQAELKRFFAEGELHG